ncbi:tyrosine-type recombinase/integrase, partial [Rhodanobacter aciditrophus]
MAVSKVKDGWKVDFRVGGKQGKRYRKTCKTKNEAERYQKFVEAQFIAEGKPWNEKPKDPRLLSDLVELWSKHFGVKLKKHHARRLKLDQIVLALGDPIAAQLTPKQWNEYLSSRIANGRKTATINESIAFLNAVYNGLYKIGEVDFENPIKSVPKLRIRQTEMSFLSLEQIDSLLAVMDGECRLITEVCLSTGARWNEANGLTRSRVQNSKVTFSDTKGGKNRSIPISDDLFFMIQEHAQQVGRNQLFSPQMKLFYECLDLAGIELPKGQKTHVLRHTFASHFMINGGNILSLQKILGHSSISMTMRYAHLSPNHLMDAIHYNPRSSGQKVDSKA